MLRREGKGGRFPHLRFDHLLLFTMLVHQNFIYYICHVFLPSCLMSENFAKCKVSSLENYTFISLFHSLRNHVPITKSSVSAHASIHKLNHFFVVTYFTRFYWFNKSLLPFCCVFCTSLVYASSSHRAVLQPSLSHHFHYCHSFLLPVLSWVLPMQCFHNQCSQSPFLLNF